MAVLRRWGGVASVLLLLSALLFHFTIHKSKLPEVVEPGALTLPWGHLPDVSPVSLYALKNAHGVAVFITDYGATVVGLRTPDRYGRMTDIVLGFDSIDGYTSPTYRRGSPYFGAVIGRYANRIAGGRFVLNGKSISVSVNVPPSHLHGGFVGFDKALWRATAVHAGAEPSLELHYQSKSGEEGYPGNLDVTVVYTLKNDALEIGYEATSEQDTVINLTNHAYFNLKGEGEGDILDHQLQLDSDYFTPANSSLVPTGELRSTKGTPFDFKEPTTIGSRINAPNEQLAFARGYDHNFALIDADGTLRHAARLLERTTGRTLEVWTTEPGIQVYTGNYLQGDFIGKQGKIYSPRSGICLETQHFPDSPNHDQFPSTVLRAGVTYKSKTIFQFGFE